MTPIWHIAIAALLAVAMGLPVAAVAQTDNPHTLLAQAQQLLDAQNYEAAAAAANKARTLAQANNDSSAELRSMYQQGRAQHYLGNMSDAARYYAQAYRHPHTELDSNQLLVGRIAYGLSIAYNRLGLYDKALEYSFVALAEAHTRDSAQVLARYSVHAWALFKLKQYEEALYYNRKSYAHAVRTGNDNNKYTCLTVRGQIYLQQGLLDSAATAHHTLETLLLEANDSDALASTKGDLSDVYKAKGELGKAEQYIREALALSSNPNWISGRLALAEILVQQQRYALALESLDSAWPLAQAERNYGALRRAATSFANVHLARGETDQAGHYFELASAYQDSLFQVEKSRAVAALQVINEVKQKDGTIEQQGQQLEVLDEENTVQRQQLWMATGAVLVLLALLSAILWLYRSVRKQSALVAKRDQEKAVLLKEIHHRVKNNLAVISSLLNLQSGSIEDETALEAVREGRNRVKSIALIHQKLYQTEDVAAIEVAAYMEELGTTLKAAFGQQQCSLTVDVLPSGTTLDIDTAVPFGLMLNELFTNAFKYGGVAEQPLEISIALRAVAEATGYVLEFRDNGPGFPADFDPKKSRSLGLKLIRMLSKQLRGNASFESDNGALVRIRFQPTEVRKSID